MSIYCIFCSKIWRRAAKSAKLHSQLLASTLLISKGPEMAKIELFCAELCFKVIGRYLCWDHLSTSLAWLHGLLTFRINLSSSPEWRPNGPTFRFKNELESNKGKADKLFAFKVPSYIYSTLHSIIHSKRLTQMELAPTKERNSLETRKNRRFFENKYI